MPLCLTGALVAPLTGQVAVAGADASRSRVPEADWPLPSGDAVLIDGEWWSLIGDPAAVPRVEALASLIRRVEQQSVLTGGARSRARLVDAAMGDVDGDGTDELVLAFRRPFRRTLINSTRPRRAWVDADGLSAHVGVYRPSDLDEIWVAGTLVHPVVSLAACDGALAVAYGWLDRPGVRAASAWRWHGFGFLPEEPLQGTGIPACMDIDGDGRSEPAITRRSER